MLRDTDNRFYWLQADKFIYGKSGGSLVPARMEGDIKGINGNNVVLIKSLGVRRMTLWFSQDMIDWSKPVRVVVNGTAVRGYKPKVLLPDLQVLLDDYHERGDRRMLFLNKLEIGPIP